MGLGLLREACLVHEMVALQHCSKSTKYELEEGSYNDPVCEQKIRNFQTTEMVMKRTFTKRNDESKTLICMHKKTSEFNYIE